MILQDSTERIVGNTGVVFYTVIIACSACSRHFKCERNRAKKRTHFMCGKCYSKSSIKGDKLKGKTPPNKQIKCIIPCFHCNKSHERSKKHLQIHSKVFCNSKCQIAWQRKNTDFNKGEKNPAYKHGQRVGGKTPFYGEGFTKGLKLFIKKRDGFSCQICKTYYGGKKSNYLDVHHIDEDKFNNEISNLITLCKPCHTNLHWGKTSLQIVEKRL